MKVIRIAAAVLLTGLALPAAPAAASGGTFTYMLCANPDTGRGTAPANGVFPDGVTMSAGHLNMSTLQSAQACAGTVDGSRGMVIKPNGAYFLAQQQGTVLSFTAPPEVRFLDAYVWRRMNTDDGMMTAFVRSSSDSIYASPNFDRCEQPGWGCLGRGSHDAFSPGNQTYVGGSHEGMPQGFKWFWRCAWFGCNVDDAGGISVYGAKVQLADDASPSGTLGVGGLGSDAVLRGVERVAFSARDGQAGVYRARVLVDGAPRPWVSVDGGSSSCRDVNFGNGDEYEFGRARPCPSAIESAIELNTATVPDGPHEIQLVVEDAGGRWTRLMDRSVVVDNVAEPSVVSAPAVSGAARDGETLSASAGVWDDHGSGTPLTVTRRWERCDGSSCVALPESGGSVVLDDGDVGKRFRVVETAVNGEGSASASSVMTEVVVDTPAPRSTGAPTLTGNTRRGNLLAASPGGWDDHGVPGEPVVVRQWQRCRVTGVECADVAGATGMTYELGDADLNRRLRVVETARNGEGSTSVLSGLSGQVTREDGTLPPNNNGEDDDGDGAIDEPDEFAGSDGGGGGGGGTGTSGASGRPGANGRDGAGPSTTQPSRDPRSLVAPNGANASLAARITASFRDGRGVLKVPYGRGAVVEGRVLDEAGRPISRAVVAVSAVVSIRGAVASARPGVVTGEDGRFTYALRRRSSSERLRFSYSAERDGPPVAQDELELRVTAGVRLSVRLRGAVVTYRGTVVSGPMPRRGKLVVIQGRVKGGSWQTFATRRARGRGRFRGRYRLKLRVPGRQLQFRARVVAEEGFPYLTGVSRAVTRTVR